MMDTEVNYIDTENNTNFQIAKEILSNRNQLVLRLNICHGPSRTIKSLLLLAKIDHQEMKIGYERTLSCDLNQNPDKDSHLVKLI